MSDFTEEVLSQWQYQGKHKPLKKEDIDISLDFDKYVQTSLFVINKIKEQRNILAAELLTLRQEHEKLEKRLQVIAAKSARRKREVRRLHKSIEFRERVMAYGKRLFGHGSPQRKVINK
jgi:regulator of replication initiation timing